MLGLVWRVVYQEWNRAGLEFDSSFEVVSLFALLGLVLSCVLLATDGSVMPPLSLTALSYHDG